MIEMDAEAETRKMRPGSAWLFTSVSAKLAQAARDLEQQRGARNLDQFRAESDLRKCDFR